MSGIMIARRGTMRPSSSGGILGESTTAEYWKASQYTATQLTGLKNGLHAVFGAGTAAPTRLVFNGTKYIFLPGIAGNNLSLANPAALSDYTVTYEDLTTVTVLAVVANPIIFGNTDANFSAKSVRQIEVRNTIGQAVTARFIANNAVEPYATFVDSFTQTWTINRAASGKKSSLVDQTLLLLGTDDFLEVADNALLDFAAGDSFTVAVLGRWYGASGNQFWCDKRTVAGYALYSTATPQAYIADAGASVNVSGPTMPVGTISLVSNRRDTAADLVKAGVDGTANTATDTTTASLANTGSLWFGRRLDNADFLHAEIMAMAVIGRDVTDPEMTTLKTELLVP